MKKRFLPILLAFLVGCSSGTSTANSSIEASSDSAIIDEKNTVSDEYSFTEEQRTFTEDNITMTFDRCYFDEDGNLAIDFSVTNNYDVEIFLANYLTPYINNESFSFKCALVMGPGETVEDTLHFSDSSSLKETELTYLNIGFIVYDRSSGSVDEDGKVRYSTELLEFFVDLNPVQN